MRWRARATISCSSATTRSQSALAARANTTSGDLWGKIQELCERDGVPDVAACIVNLYSLNTGQLKPAEKVVERHGGWEGVRREQAAVMTFDWEDWLRENTWS